MLVVLDILRSARWSGLRWRRLGSARTRPARQAQRELIAKAIGPIWEANHVWLILVVVVLFTAFPPAYALISTSCTSRFFCSCSASCFRGSAFIFRAYDATAARDGGGEYSQWRAYLRRYC